VITARFPNTTTRSPRRPRVFVAVSAYSPGPADRSICDVPARHLARFTSDLGCSSPQPGRRVRAAVASSARSSQPVVRRSRWQRRRWLSTGHRSRDVVHVDSVARIQFLLWALEPDEKRCDTPRRQTVLDRSVTAPLPCPIVLLRFGSAPLREGFFVARIETRFASGDIEGTTSSSADVPPHTPHAVPCHQQFRQRNRACSSVGLGRPLDRDTRGERRPLRREMSTQVRSTSVPCGDVAPPSCSLLSESEAVRRPRLRDGQVGQIRWCHRSLRPSIVRACSATSRFRALRAPRR
jgi:hypothetical protein